MSIHFIKKDSRELVTLLVCKGGTGEIVEFDDDDITGYPYRILSHTTRRMFWCNEREFKREHRQARD